VNGEAVSSNDESRDCCRVPDLAVVDRRMNRECRSGWKVVVGKA
jgi:hypothetical protein